MYNYKCLNLYLYIFISYRHTVTSSTCTILICEMEMKILYILLFTSFRMVNYNCDYKYLLIQHISFFRSAIRWEHYILVFYVCN